ncbi:MAG: hypothetical protein M0Z78_08930 [Betaproteobacteria bacterium]|nr:hypothetical protein [Betaproteobacteria bacterium]
MSKTVRFTFSLPTDGELFLAMADFNRHERAVIIKQALHAYFNADRRSVHAESATLAHTVVPSVQDKSSRAADVLGDFGD